MNKYNLWLDGVSAEDVGIMFLSPLELDAPKPRVKAEPIPGRNGDLHIFDGSFENRRATVGGCLYREDYVKRGFNELNNWLFGSLGYRQLITDDDPEHFMMARVLNGGDVAAKARKVAPFKIRFDCKPQRFLVDGLQPIVISSGDEYTFYSPVAFPSKPLLKIYYTVSTGNISHFTVNGQTVNVSTLVVANRQYVYHDAEIENTYTDSQSYDNVISGAEGLSLVPGENTVSFDGEITKIEIIPRWWEL